jgi:PAS domain S-box-containing protein
LALFAGLASAYLLAPIRSWWSAWVVLGMLAATWTGCVLLLSTTGFMLSPLPVTAALVCAFPVVTLLNYLLEKQRAERTELQLSEVQRESESRYQRLVENINDAIIVDDAEGRLLFANRRFREWFGLEGKDIRKVSLEDCVAPEWRAALRDQHSRRMRGESVPEQDSYECMRPDGSRIWIEALVTNVEEDGRIVGTQSALRDITERKQIEARNLQAQKMETIGRLAGGVAHDFNNLLTVINGYSEMLLADRPNNPECQAGLQEIRAAGERAAELTQNLLAFSRKQLAKLEPLDLNVVVLEAEKMFGPLIGEDVELITRLSPALGRVMADSVQLHQILMNLLVNARDAMPRGGKIVIETKNVEDDVYLGVTDTGTGMSDEVKRHLFEPFFTTKEPGKGTGLGLATIYGIVQQSGGRIEVSSSLGQGATFHIYLPCVTAQRSAQSGASDPGRIMRGAGTVLVVEDQEAVRRYLRVALEDFGYNVLLAANGPDALALSGQFAGRIDLLLVDLVLPLMNGRELAEKLKRARPELKVLFTSGYAEETMGSRGIAGDLPYLPKPFNRQMLAARVRDALSPGEPRSGASGAG